MPGEPAGKAWKTAFSTYLTGLADAPAGLAPLPEAGLERVSCVRLKLAQEVAVAV